MLVGGWLLYDLLWRYQSGELPCMIPLIISNHPDTARLAEFYQIPFHVIPVTKDTKAQAEDKLRIAQAQLVGWLEGVFHGIQTALFAQQMAARQQLEQMRGQLPPGEDQPGARGPDTRPGTYL